MSVDYTGNYGIGVKVIKKEFDEESKYNEDFIGYLDDVLENTDYYYFEVGDSMYSGKENDIYVCINNFIEFPLIVSKFEEKVNKFVTFLNNNEIEFEGEINEVGGLLID